MIPWAGFERRWRDRLCAAAIPGVDGGELPGYGGAATEAFWERFDRVASPNFQVGLRVAVWTLTLAAVPRSRPRLFTSLSAEDQDAVLVRCLEHRLRAVRDLTAVLRLAACMAYFDDPAVRERVGAASRRRA